MVSFWYNFCFICGDFVDSLCCFKDCVLVVLGFSLFGLDFFFPQ